MKENRREFPGYVYGNNFFPEGTVVGTLPHYGCSHSTGIVKKNNEKTGLPYIIACSHCPAKGLIPNVSARV